MALVLAHAGSAWWVHQRVLSGGVDRPLAGWFFNNGGSSSGALALVADVQTRPSGQGTRTVRMPA